MKREQILQSSLDIIRQYGLEHLTMDEVARQGGISKKTIYQFFSNKESLLMELVSTFTEEGYHRFSEGLDHAEAGEEKLLFIVRFLLELSSQVPFTNLLYLQKYHKDCYGLFEQLHQEIYQLLERELIAEQQKGIVYEDVDPGLYCLLLKTQLQHFRKEYPRLQGQEIFLKWQEQLTLSFRRSVLQKG